MNSQQLSDILAMSGYGVYVWSAFGITSLVLIILYRLSQVRLRKALKVAKKINIKK